VIISKETIASPLSFTPSTLLVMNKPSLDKFGPRLKKQGLLILNSSLIDKEPERSDIKVIKLPANKLAEDAGNIRSANMVMLGAYLALRKLTSVKKACSLLQDVLPKRWHELLEVNRKSLISGDEFVRQPGKTVLSTSR
jgi:2-oxoglutarate ferredoxin oxidoreductase subunit gamma